MPKHWSENTHPREKGSIAEERFFEAWSDQKDLPKWVVLIDRPTKHEDLFEKTDAVIIRIAGPNLKVQIKSYLLEEKEEQDLMKFGVIPISILSRDTDSWIRQKTHMALQKFSLFTKERTEYKTSGTALCKKRHNKKNSKKRRA